MRKWYVCDLMGVDGPRSRHLSAKLWSLLNAHREEPSTMQITTIGIDLAKHVFQVHGVDADGNVVLRRKLRRGGVISFFTKLPPILVGMEACATSHYGRGAWRAWAIFFA